MKPFSDTEIQRRLNKLERLLLETFGFSVKIVEGVPTTDGSEAEGDVVYDSTNGNLYVFDGNSFNLGSEQIHFGYASDVQNTNDQGLVSAASDVTSFSTNPSVNGVALPWEGKFIGSTIPTAVTQYTWTNVKGEQGDQGVQGIQGVPGEAAVKVFQISISEPSIPSDSISTPVGWLANPTTTGLGVRSTQDGGVIQFTLNPTGNFDQTYATGFPAGFLQTTQNSRTEIRFFNNANRTGATLEDANNVILGLFVSDNALTLSEKLAEYAELINNWANGSVNVTVSGGNLIFYSNDLLVQMSTAATIASSPDNDFVASSAVLRKNLISKLWSVSGTRPTISSDYTWADLILESGTEGAQGLAGANIIDYSDLVQYDIGDLVGYNDTQWRTLVSIPSTNTTPPAENSSWSQISTIAQAGDAGSGEENVQSDWTEAVTSVDSFIKNKPTTITGTQSDAITANTNKRTYPSVDQTKLGTIPTLPVGIPTDTSKEYVLKLTDVAGTEIATWEQGSGGSGETNVQSNWTETTVTSDSFIQNKPTTITGTQSDAITANSLKVGFTALLAQDALDISDDGDILTYKNKTGATQTFEPSGSGETNVNANWTEASSASDAFIQNKPTTISGGQASAITANSLKTSFTALLAQSALDISDDDSNTLTYKDKLGATKTFTPSGSGDDNVQSNWTQATTTADDFIKNKPTTISGGQASAITANSLKRTYPSGDQTKLSGITSGADVTTDFVGQTGAGNYTIPVRDAGETLTKFLREDGDWEIPVGTGGENNVQANWTEATTTSDAFIQNKPTTISGGQASAITANSLKTGITGTQTNAITANSLKVGYTATLARGALNISNTSTTLTYKDNAGTTQTFIPSQTGEDNVNANWTETTASNDAFIQNKPTTITTIQRDAIIANSLKRTYPLVDETRLANIPLAPAGILADTSKNYNLKVEDVAGTETVTWAEDTGGAGGTAAPAIIDTNGVVSFANNVTGEEVRALVGTTKLPQSDILTIAILDSTTVGVDTTGNVLANMSGFANSVDYATRVNNYQWSTSTPSSITLATGLAYAVVTTTDQVEGMLTNNTGSNISLNNIKATVVVNVTSFVSGSSIRLKVDDDASLDMFSTPVVITADGDYTLNLDFTSSSVFRTDRPLNLGLRLIDSDNTDTLSITSVLINGNQTNTAYTLNLDSDGTLLNHTFSESFTTGDSSTDMLQQIKDTVLAKYPEGLTISSITSEKVTKLAPHTYFSRVTAANLGLVNFAGMPSVYGWDLRADSSATSSVVYTDWNSWIGKYLMVANNDFGSSDGLVEDTSYTVTIDDIGNAGASAIIIGTYGSGFDFIDENNIIITDGFTVESIVYSAGTPPQVGRLLVISEQEDDAHRMHINLHSNRFFKEEFTLTRNSGTSFESGAIIEQNVPSFEGGLAYRTSDFTAVDNNDYYVNPSAGSIIIDLQYVIPAMVTQRGLLIRKFRIIPIQNNSVDKLITLNAEGNLFDQLSSTVVLPLGNNVVEIIVIYDYVAQTHVLETNIGSSSIFRLEEGMATALANQIFRRGAISTFSTETYVYLGADYITTSASALPSAGGDWKQLT